MEIYAFILCCALVSSVVAFTIHDVAPKYNRNVSQLQIAESQACKCENGRCVTDNRGRTKCHCYPGYALQDESTCAPCDCGEKGKCMFIAHPKSAGGSLYVKKCFCEVGSAEKDGTCVDCHCGENSKCEFEGEEKICYCIEGYSEKEGVCTKCDCGTFGECKFELGKKRCICDEGFMEHGGYCKECNCGSFGVCALRDGTKQCTCYDGFSDNKGTCERCDCGEYSYSCGFKDGEKICNCRMDDVKRAQFGGRCVDCNCGYQSVGCRFENNGKKTCQCIEGYVQKGQVCKVACSTYHQCQNGGFCKEGICNCLPGTSGEFCEIIDDCDHLCPKQRDINCTYDVERKQAFCKCIDEKMGFVPEIKMCRPTCDDYTSVCKNGGKCERTYYSRFCHCLEGTRGHFCEIVTECEERRCGKDAVCRYDVNKRSANCVCYNKELSFDSTDLKCKKTCRVDEDIYLHGHVSSDCENGGLCTGSGSSKFCLCLEGTSGDFCEKIPGCDAKDCGPNAKCVYDVQKRVALCVCNDENYAFDTKSYECRRTCNDDMECENGGICEGGEYFHFCRCLEGTYSDFCEKVVGCDVKNCGNEAKCVYDIEKKSPVCVCDDEKFSFDPVDRKCKRKCFHSSDCKNGGNCLERDSAAFCSCLDGTKGDFCEDVIECGVKNCGYDAKCVYDVDRKAAFCQCNEEGYSFDPRDIKCKKRCSEDSECLNGGKCVQNWWFSSVCECLSGTSGDLCEIVEECEKHRNKCGGDAKCVFDVGQGKAVCRCPVVGEEYDSLIGKCRRICDEKMSCHNGGKCISRGDFNFCECLSGTTGDSCEIVEKCVKDKGMCKGDSRCSFDVTKEEAFCECTDEGKGYDPVSGKCKYTCAYDAMCNNGGLCMHSGDHLFCQCKRGTSGAFCEIIDECERHVCGDSEDILCKYDIKKEAVRCECKDSGSLYDAKTKTCKVCDCGKNAISCNFENGQKVCVCPEAFSVENGICKKKYCTEKNCFQGKCEVIDDKEVCTCYEGYVLDGDYCRKLNCSKTPCINGTCIVRHGNVEECVCQAGFTLNFNTCIRGVCRFDTCFGGRCRTIDGELICVCPKKFHLVGIGCFETVCEEQPCFGGKCVVENGEEICTCPDGYKLENNVCKKIICEKKNCFGGQCHIVDGAEECTCPAGFSLFEDVCRENLGRYWKNKTLI